jgi:hypothetical protein
MTDSEVCWNWRKPAPSQSVGRAAPESAINASPGSSMARSGIHLSPWMRQPLAAFCSAARDRGRISSWTCNERGSLSVINKAAMARDRDCVGTVMRIQLAEYSLHAGLDRVLAHMQGASDLCILMTGQG